MNSAMYYKKGIQGTFIEQVAAMVFFSDQGNKAGI